MSVHSRFSDRTEVSPAHSYKTNSNSTARLSSDLSSSVRFESWPVDYVQQSPGSDLLGLASRAPRERPITKDRLLAYQLYTDDINFVQDQSNYLNVGLNHKMQQSLLTDDGQSAPKFLPGYTLTNQLTSVHLSSLLYFAVDDRTGASAIVKFSPDVTEYAHLARFLTEWYITSGSNPPQRHRLWNNSSIESPYMSNDASDISNEDHRRSLSFPITLPTGVPGILYPHKTLNVALDKNDSLLVRMALVYHDHGYKTIRDHYKEVVRAANADEKTSLQSSSVRSVLSDLSDGDKHLPTRNMIRTNLGLGEFDDLANRVPQVPRLRHVMIDILRDLLAVVNTVTLCHEMGIVHNGITSHHILRASDLMSEEERKSHGVVLTGWDFSFTIAGEDSFHGYRKHNLSEIPDLLPYMSPENTGETISLVDYRSDIYSLGIVFYELIVGCLPFVSENPIRLRKMHLNQRPIKPETLGASWISGRLSDIILKCLEKDPDNRYLEGYSLMADLQAVIAEYLDVQPSEIASSSYSSVPHVDYSTKNFGKLPYYHTSMSRIRRFETRQQIFDCFNKNAEGTKFIMVKGEAGIGKTTVLEEVRGHAVSMYNFVVTWTYNCADMNTKYSFVVNGIHTITKQILASSKDNIAEWRSLLMSRIDVDLSILFQSIPELKILLGPRYRSIHEGGSLEASSKSSRSTSSHISSFLDDDSDPTDAEDMNFSSLRLNGFDEQALNVELKYKYLFKKFFSVVAERGLTIILDDLHWCPPDEIQFLKDMVQFCEDESESPSLTVLAGYRSSPPNCEVEKPCVSLLEVEKMVGNTGIPYFEFEMSRLSTTQFNDFVGLSSFPTVYGLEVATKLRDLSRGNRLAFHYLSRYLRLRKDTDGFLLEGLKQEDKSDELSQFITDIVSKQLHFCLPEKAIKLLKFAAIVCVNGLFKITDLMVSTGWPLAEIYEILHLCIEARILVPTGIYYKIPFHMVTRDNFPFDINDSVILELTEKARYRFDHDIVQLCLLKEIQDAKELENYHRVCGLRMLKSISLDNNSNINSYLSMASHVLNGCSAAEEDEYERYYHALVTGGRYALATSNLQMALNFFEASMQFIKKDCGRRKLKIMITLCQCHFLLKNYGECASIVAQAEEEFGHNNWTVLHLKVRSLIQMKQYRKGIKKALQGLELLNIEVSVDSKKCRQIGMKYLAQLPLSITEIREMRKIKKATDQGFILIADLIMDVIGVTYVLCLPDLRLALLTQLVLQMLTHGYTTSCAIPLLHFANFFVQPNQHRSVLKACELSDVAVALVNSAKGTSTSLSEQINENYVFYMAMFKQPLLELLKVSPLFSLDNASVIRPSDSSLIHLEVWCKFALTHIVGINYSMNTAILLKRSVMFDRDEDQVIYSHCLGLWSEEYSIEHYIDQIKPLNISSSPDSEFVYLANAVIWLSVEGKYNEGSEIVLDRAYHLLKKLPVSILHVEFYFYAITCLCFNTSSSAHSASLSLAKAMRNTFGFWSEVHNSNFISKAAIIDACIKSSSTDQPSLAVLDSFEEAIEAATGAKLWIDVAWANHLCALWLSKVSQKRANTYARNAYSMYATLKSEKQMRRLKVEFHGLFGNFDWAGVPQIPDKILFKLEGSQSPVDRLNHVFNKQRISDPDVQMSINNPFDETTRSMVVDAEPSHGNLGLQPTSDEWRQALKLCLAISQSSSIDHIVSKLLESILLFSGVDYGAIVLNNADEEPNIKAIGSVNNLYKLDNELLSARTDLVPYDLVIDCLLNGEIINRDDNPSHFDAKFGKHYYYRHNPCSSALCIPIKTFSVLGVVYLERHTYHREIMQNKPYFDNTKIDLLELLCSHAAVSFSKSLVYAQMELAKKTAEDATAEKASFLANMSHEIRTPFNSLFACSVFLLDTELNTSQKEYVETIKASALVTLSIIDGILAFSKIEHGSFTLESAPFSINDTIESAIQISSEQSIDSEVELAYFNRCPEIETVIGDTTRIRQIIINLIGNAVKFTTAGYVKVILSAEPITDERYEVMISVEDTGIGIPQGSKSKVFGAFSQVDGSSRRVFGGSGLGLAISRKLAEVMNGRITFKSEEGQGSTFYFCCPLEVKLAQTIKPSRVQKVCVVSKAQLKRASVKELVESHGGMAVLFDNHRDLMKSKFTFDFILIDQDSYPEEDVDFKAAMRNIKCHVYLIAKFGLNVSDLDLKDMGVNSLVFTPIKMSKIIDLMRRALGVPTLDAANGKAPKKLLSAKYALRILIAEDNAINLRVALQHLKKLGYIADHAKDGVEAIAKCESRLKDGEMYDVIFMDIQMPRKDGITATVELRQSFASRGYQSFLPHIIALTANVAGEDRGKCLECGMVDFVSKPILPEELERVLKKVGEMLTDRS